MAECGLTNLATCLPQMFFEFVLSLFNMALEPIVKLVKSLLIEPVNVTLFHSFWVVIVYVISLFYGLFFIFAGFNFLISGYDAVKREKAKSWLRNVIFMIIFVQASFLLYSLIIELGALLTAGVVDLINPDFFLLKADNIGSLGLQLILLIPYIITLVLTILLLGLRYLLVSIGVVLFPFALFFYFIPPLQSYGKMMLNALITLIFMTFFDAIILFGASALTTIGIFKDFQIIITTIAFLTVDIAMVLIMIFVIVKAAFSVLDSDVGRNVARATKYVV